MFLFALSVLTQIKRSRSIINNNREKTLAYHAAKLTLQRRHQLASLSTSSAASLLPRPTSSHVISLSNRQQSRRQSQSHTDIFQESNYLRELRGDKPLLQQKKVWAEGGEDKGVVLQVKVHHPLARTKNSATSATCKYNIPSLLSFCNMM